MVRRPWKAVAVPRVSDYASQDKASSILSPAIKNQQKHPRKKYVADYLNADSGSEQHEILNLTRNSMASSQTSQGGNFSQNQPNLIMRHISGQNVPGNHNYLDSTVNTAGQNVSTSRGMQQKSVAFSNEPTE